MMLIWRLIATIRSLHFILERRDFFDELTGSFLNSLMQRDAPISSTLSMAPVVAAVLLILSSTVGLVIACIILLPESTTLSPKLSEFSMAASDSPPALFVDAL